MRRAIRSLFARATFRSFSSQPPTRASRLNRRQLSVTNLEDRCTPALFIVNSIGDDTTGAGGTGNMGDLRYCLTQANADTTTLDMIQFDGTVFGSAKTIVLGGVPLLINGPTDVIGLPGKVTISGDNLSNVLFINLAGDTTAPVNVSDLSITSGKLTGPAEAGAGIGVQDGVVTLNNITITKCFGRSDGVGLAVVGAGTFVASNCVISGNTGDATVNTINQGVGASVAGSTNATFNDCVFISNVGTTTDVGTPAGQMRGGGIAEATTGTFIMNNCLISGNSSNSAGGGLYIGGSGGLTQLNNTIISSNSTTSGTGGGIGHAASATILEVNDSLLQNNFSPNSGGAFGCFFGGNDATFSFVRTRIINNSTNGPGAGFINFGTRPASFSFTDSTISGNIAGAAGGGMYSRYSVALSFVNTTVSNNVAVGSGGGVFTAQGATAAPATAAPIEIINSTFSNNSATLSGAGFFMTTFAGGTIGTALISNSTFFGNKGGTAGGSGAGVRFSGGAGNLTTATIQNSTIANNDQKTVGGAGGLSSAMGGNITILNSLIARNTVNSVLTGNDKTDIERVGTGLIDIDFSLVGVEPVAVPYTVLTPGSMKTGTNAAPLDPLLRPMFNYGGRTATVPQQPGAGAAQGVNSAGATTLTFDQRGGLPLPGFSRTFGGVSDMGAVEQNVPLPWVTGVTSPDVVTAGGTSYDVTITFNGTANLDTTGTFGAPNAVQFQRRGTFDAPFFGTLKSADPPGTSVTAVYTITPPGGAWSSTNNGIYDISIVADKLKDIDGDAVPESLYGSFTVGVPQLIIVNAANDETSDTDGKISLREALLFANASKGMDTIQFDPAVFSGATTIALVQGTLPVTDSVIIQGPAQELTLDRLMSGTVMSITGAGTLNVEISKLTMINGQKIGSFFGFEGAAINIGDENVTLTDCVFRNNISEAGGGAVYIAGGSLTVDNCKFEMNSAPITTAGTAGVSNPGGALYFNGGSKLIITNTVFMGNQSAGRGGALAVSNAAMVSISDTVFTSNSVTSTGFNGGAVALLNVADTTFTNVQFNSNELLMTGNAGAMFIDGASTVTINLSTFDGNKTVDGFGGAIAINNTATGSLTINQSTFKNNHAQGFIGRGGAISIGGDTAVTISQSTFNNNKADFAGGGIIYENGMTAPLLIENSTFSANMAPLADGGAIMIANVAASVTVRNNTLTLNTAGVNGGAIHVDLFTGTFTLSSNIISGNTAGNTTTNDIGASALTTFTANANLTGPLEPTLINFMGAGNIVTMDAKLGALANNGGPTQTHLPATNSQAINNGLANGLTTDQRGGPRTSGAATDIGSVERAGAPMVANVIINNGDAQRSMVTEIKVVFDQSVTIANLANAFKVERYGSLVTPPGAVAIDVTGSGTTYTITFKAGGTVGIDPNNSLQDGQYRITVVAAEVSGDGGNMAADSITNSWRLFGDGNGDGTVNAADFNEFRMVYGTSGPAGFRFDFDATGTINAADFNAFRTRYGLSGFNIP